MIADAIREAWSTSRANPLRSGLGSLAIACAVATVTLAVTALDGLTAFARQNTARIFGSDAFVLARIGSAGQISRRELEEKLSRNLPIRRTDYAFLVKAAGNSVQYAPTAQRQVEVTAGSRKVERVPVTGTTAALAEIRDLDIAQGRFFQQADDARGRQVAFIGADLADALFPASDPLEREVRIAGRGFRIVGVQARIGGSAGAALDKYVWIPLTAFERAFGAPDTLQVYARAAGITGDAAEDRTATSLRARRRLRPGVPDNFDIVLPSAARDFVTAISGRVGDAALPIAATALLAAIVVVTNTTLASVSQRTREIGVRRAVGATRRRIVMEVLFESTLVALIGGLAGVAASLLLVRAFAGITELPLAVLPETAAWALAAAALSGLASGMYPARRASRLSVVSAMREQ